MQSGVSCPHHTLRQLFVIALLASGCLPFGGAHDGTGNTPPPSDTTASALLAGDWISTINDSCSEFFDATPPSFAFGVGCVAADSSLDFEVQKGIYSLTGDSLVLTNQQASCAGTAAQDGETVTVTATSLTLSDTAGLAQFVRNTAPAGSASAVYGCFNMGVFTPSPLAPI